jgi:hypothetical protein
MPIYTPAAQAPPTSYTLPADGEKVKAASVNPTFEDLADAVKYLYSGGTLLAFATKPFSGTDSNSTFGADTPVVAVPTLTANRTYTLSESGSLLVDGSRIRIYKLGTANQLTIQAATGPTTIATFPAGSKCWADFIFQLPGPTWFTCAWGGGTTVP